MCIKAELLHGSCRGVFLAQPGDLPQPEDLSQPIEDTYFDSDDVDKTLFDGEMGHILKKAT